MVDHSAPIDAIDSATLTGVVRQLLRDERAGVRTWQCNPIAVPVGSAFTAGLYRVQGTAHLAGAVVPWSVVVKVIRRPSNTAAYDLPNGTPYWRREACAYESGLLRELPQGLTAPRCLGVVSQPDDSVCLWMEDIADRHHDRWPRDLYHQAARHLGQFNGAYLAGRPLPTYPWLAVQPIRAWADAQTTSVHLIDRQEIWREPLLRRAYPVPVADRLRRLWSGREAIFDALARLPQTLCHFDAGHHNLLPQPAAGGAAHTVALDWESAGIAGVGEEIGLLISSPFIRHALDRSEMPYIHQSVFEGYLAGLRDAGWYGPWRAVRLGFAANAALRFVFRATGLRDAVDKTKRAREEQRWGCAYDELIEDRAALTYALLDLADEAYSLMERA